MSFYIFYELCATRCSYCRGVCGDIKLCVNMDLCDTVEGCTNGDATERRLRKQDEQHV